MMHFPIVAEAFDVVWPEVVTLAKESINYYDLRFSESSKTPCSKVCSKSNCNTYIKADRRRMGVMSKESLLFKNHGELNETSRCNYSHSHSPCSLTNILMNIAIFKW